MKFLVYFIGAFLMIQHHGVDCTLDAKLSRLQEKASKTLIIPYHKANLSEPEIQELANNLQESCDCDVQHLPFTKTFILTYKDKNGIMVERLTLPAGAVLRHDKFVNISFHGDYRDIVKIASSDVKMDPGYHLQWAFQDLSNNADINADKAWEIYQSDGIGGNARSLDPRQKYLAGAIIAVVDTGIDYNHPDLKDVMWTNPGEIPGNGIDDDDNGIIDDFHGADFSDTEPKGDPMDDNGHGTHCAGIIAAKANNGDGVRGVASFVKGKVKVMAIKFADKNGRLLIQSNVVKAMEYLLANGADVSSHSYSIEDTYDEDLYNILETNEYHLAVAASGNSGRVIDAKSRITPCALGAKNTMCVASSTNENTRSPFSNVGKEIVDVFAPGSHILSTYLNADYKYMWGTSMATPYVSGLAALVKSMRVRLSGKEVKNLIVKNVNQMDQYRHLVTSEGLIDMAKTISATRKRKISG